MIKFENKSNGRYYYLIINKDMFNEIVLTIIRGGNFNRVIRHYGFNCKTTILKEISRISKLRMKRGYILVD
jgi:hypothetical protein